MDPKYLRAFYTWERQQVAEILESSEAPLVVNQKIMMAISAVTIITIYPIHKAAEHNDLANLTKILQAGGRVEIEAEMSETGQGRRLTTLRKAVAIAIEHGYLALLDHLLPPTLLNSIIDRTDIMKGHWFGPTRSISVHSWTPLGAAIRFQQRSILKYLLFVRKVDIEQICYTIDKEKKGNGTYAAKVRSQSLAYDYRTFPAMKVIDFLAQLPQMLIVRNLLLCSRKDPASFFFEAHFPLDLFKSILYLLNLTLK